MGYDTLRQNIRNKVYTNDNQEITGSAMQEVLLESVRVMEDEDQKIKNDIAEREKKLLQGTHPEMTTGSAESLTESGEDELLEKIRSSGISPVIPIEWGALVDLRDKGELVPGYQYRITDYVTLTSEYGTMSAHHPFDIIVTANSKNSLSEIARAALHDGDTYFQDSKLNAWKLCYCLDNDSTRFAWAAEAGIYTDDALWFKPRGKVTIDGTPYYLWYNEEFGLPNDEGESAGYLASVEAFPSVGSECWLVNVEEGILIGSEYFSIVERIGVEGKGVIYRMIDEWGNDCPYDFKNILFIRSSLHEDCHIEGFIPDRYYYTFSWIAEDGAVLDFSIVGQSITNDEGFIVGVRNNKISPLLGYSAGAHSFWLLSKNVFISSAAYDPPHAYGIQNNILGTNCEFNTFGNQCWNNHFEYGCVGNELGDFSSYNIFQGESSNNILGAETQANSFGAGCIQNNIGAGASGNVLSRGASLNVVNGADCTLGIYAEGNMISEGSVRIKVGDNCSENSFSRCYDICLGVNTNRNIFNNCYRITLGLACKDIRLPYNSRDIVIDDNVSNVSFLEVGQGTGFVQNYHITSGVQGVVNVEKALNYIVTVSVDKDGNLVYINPTTEPDFFQAPRMEMIWHMPLEPYTFYGVEDKFLSTTIKISHPYYDRYPDKCFFAVMKKSRLSRRVSFNATTEDGQAWKKKSITRWHFFKGAKQESDGSRSILQPLLESDYVNFVNHILERGVLIGEHTHEARFYVMDSSIDVDEGLVNVVGMDSGGTILDYTPTEVNIETLREYLGFANRKGEQMFGIALVMQNPLFQVKEGTTEEAPNRYWDKQTGQYKWIISEVAPFKLTCNRPAPVEHPSDDGRYFDRACFVNISME